MSRARTVPDTDRWRPQPVDPKSGTIDHHPWRARQTVPKSLFKTSPEVLLMLYPLVLAIVWIISDERNLSPVAYFITFAWAAYIPLSLTGLVGAYSVRRFQPSAFTDSISELVVFVLPTIGRLDVLPALVRVVDSILRHAPAHLDNFRVDIALEEGAAAVERLEQHYQGDPRVRLVLVPASYYPPNGTRYKARANQYLTEVRTRAGESRDDAFVYHLDDDTAVGEDTIRSIAEFIAHHATRYHLAQGVLAFPKQLATSTFCWLADAVRPADDLTRFHFFTHMLHRPLAGLHGEHLLVRASIEAEIGWDFGPRVKVEDAYFALRFASLYPGRSRFLNSVTYGASPHSVRDLVTQRRRWASGLFSLAADRRFDWTARLPLVYAVVNWSIGLLQHVGIVLLAAYLLGNMNTSPLVPAVAAVWAFNMSYLLWVYMEGLRVNQAVSTNAPRYLPHLFATILLLPLISLVEGWAAALGLYDFVTRKSGFVVITKQA